MAVSGKYFGKYLMKRTFTELPVDSVRGKGSMKGVVYFIRAKGHDLYKIGHSFRSAESRLQECQTGCPYELHVYEKIYTNTPIELEKAIHRKLQHFRLRGEWFLIPADELKKFLTIGPPLKKGEFFELLTFEQLEQYTEEWFERIMG